MTFGSGEATALTRQSRTKIGTARVRDMDWYAASGNTANASHSHSDHIMYLYDVRTSNNRLIRNQRRFNSSIRWWLKRNDFSYKLEKDY